MKKLKFETDGVEEVKDAYSAQQLAILKSLALSLKGYRSIDYSLFMSEKEFKENPQYKDVNPTKGHNAIEIYDSVIRMAIEDSEKITSIISSILGSDFIVEDRKFVIGVPDKNIPEWVKKLNKDRKVGNLGAYIKPEFRDMTYFYGIDMHQDVLDWPSKNTDMITMYIYLEDVDELASPLHVVPRSHKHGIDVFPHDVSVDKDGKLIYTNWVNGEGGIYDVLKITGRAGTTYIWHSCILHGTAPTRADRPRISLRYLLRKNETKLDLLNESIGGPQRLAVTRKDLLMSGEDTIKGKDMLKIDKDK